MTERRLTDVVRDFLQTCQGREVSLRYVRDELKIDPSSPAWNGLRVLMTRLITEKIVKPSGRNDGIYKVLTPIKAITHLDNTSEEPIPFRFPRNHGEDETEFGLEKNIEIFPGDMLLVTGRSNYGKTAIALSMMGENLSLFKKPPILMGSEYTAADGKISPKFKRRIKKMAWASFINEDRSLNFTLLPVGFDYEDYIEPDCMNVIDWISLSGDYFLIDSIMKAIKDRVGHGIAVAVIQKNKDMEFGEGGERTVRYADAVFNIDSFGEKESLLTIGKVKSSNGKATGRTFAFSVVDFGANLSNIREVEKCKVCWGKGYVRSGQNNVQCQGCHGQKYLTRYDG